MVLSYEELKKTVPQETLDFLTYFIFYLDKYEDSYPFKGTKYYLPNDPKNFYISLWALNFIDEYKPFLGENGFDSEQYCIQKINALSINSSLYEKYNYLIPKYNDKTKYYGLQPLDIVLKWAKECVKLLDSTLFRNILSRVDITGFINHIQTYISNQNQIHEKEIEKEIFEQIPINVISYLETASAIRTLLLDKITYKSNKVCKEIDEDIVPVSLLLALYFGDQSDEKKGIKWFLEEKGLYLQSLLSVLNIKINQEEINKISKNIYAIKNLYKDYYQINSDALNINTVSIYSILKRALDRNFTNSLAIEKILSNYNCSIDIFDDIEKYVPKFLEKKKVEEKIWSCDLNDKYDESTLIYIINVVKIHQKLQEVIISNTMNKTTKLESISFLLGLYTVGLYTTGNPSLKFLEKNGITKEKILLSLGLKNDYLDDLNEIKIDYDLFKNNYKNKLLSIEKTNTIYISDIFSNIFKDNQVIKNTIEEAEPNCNYERLKREIETGKNYEETLTIEDYIQELTSITKEDLNINNMQSILNFGNALIPYSQYIHDVIDDVMHSNIDEEIEKLNGISNCIYTEKKEKKSLFSHHSNSNRTKVYFLDNYNLNLLKKEINYNIEKLKEELLQYDSIRRYLEVYAKKNREYYNIADNAIKQLNTKIDAIDSNDDEQYADYLTTTSFLHLINDKANRFTTVNLLTKKELLKVNQTIVNHFVTINSLEMARDDLIPLIESEISTYKGKVIGNKEIALTKTIIELFQALLTRKVDSTIEKVTKLQQSILPDELITSINKDINTYLQGINQANTLQNKIDELEAKGKVLIKDNNNK